MLYARGFFPEFRRRQVKPNLLLVPALLGQNLAGPFPTRSAYVPRMLDPVARP